MNGSDWTALAAACVGVLGTLVSPTLAQRVNARTRQQEFDHERAREHERLAREDARLRYEERRDCYARLNTALRALHRALSTHLHIMDGRPVTDADRQRVDEARDAYQNVYSEASLITPTAVFDATSRLDEALSVIYGMVKRMDGSPASPAIEDDPPPDTLAEARRRLREAAHLSHDLRTTMRRDLGV